MPFAKLATLVFMAATLVFVLSREILAPRLDQVRVSAAEAGTPPNETRKIDWRTLRLLDTASGHIPDELRRLDGRNIAIPGFVVPLEDNAGTTGEFLVVPYFGACIHSPPPPPNQMVWVRMSGSRQIHPGRRPVWMHGTLRIMARQSPYGKVAYQMTGSHIEPFRE